nr:hypothetical protein [Candidatus Shapirobacteria bacterium]
MIYIFHGDNIEGSRQALNLAVDKLVNTQKLRLDAKEVEVEKVNLFLNSQDMFGGPRALILTNFFSAHKATLDKLVKLIPQAQVDVYIWQDKPLLATQLKQFSQAKVILFKADNLLYKCLNLVQPGNLKSCLPIYQKVIDKGLYDLFLYLLKGNL